jgi:hypothetical protein
MNIGAYARSGIPFLLIIFLGSGLTCTNLSILFHKGFSQDSSSGISGSNNSTTGRIVVRTPGYHGAIFANQVILSTDKDSYDPGENVNLTITNMGTRPLHFSSADSKVEIKNLKTNETLIPQTLLLSRTIPSGESISISWNQDNFTGEKVNSGQYLAEVQIGTTSSNTTFSIK